MVFFSFYASRFFYTDILLSKRKVKNYGIDMQMLKMQFNSFEPLGIFLE